LSFWKYRGGRRRGLENVLFKFTCDHLNCLILVVLADEALDRKISEINDEILTAPW